jgi:hypothetical protein
MKIERGSVRAARRETARRDASNMGIPDRYFAEFWHAGATHEAGEKIKAAGRAREEAAAALARAVAAVEKGAA